jgi:hypothetical protein
MGVEKLNHIDELKLHCDNQGWYLTDHNQILVRWWDAERDFTKDQLLIMSYGGGTQSTAMLILILEGLIERPDIIIHSDTGSELPETVEFIEVAKRFCEDVLKIPFAIVNSHRGTLHDDYLKNGNIPIIGSRSCTANFKIRPQRRLVRKIVGRKNKHLARSMLGITTDEANRRTQSEVQWISLEYPLLDQLPYSRHQCIVLNAIHGWHVGKSGCFCCPYQGGKQWLELKSKNPDLFQIAVEMEENKMRVKGGRLGLYQERPLRDLENITLEESQCDSGAGCFI